MIDFVEFASDLGFIEGPVWNANKQTISIVSINRGLVYSLDSDGNILGAVETGGGPNGMVLSPEGLLVAQNGGIFGASGAAVPGVQLVANQTARYVSEGCYKAPNDLAFGPDGLLYITDPETDRAVLEPLPGKVFSFDPRDGSSRVVLENRLCPNGIAFEKGGASLLLAQTQARIVERLRVKHGALESAGTFCELQNGRPDGIAIDEEGRAWICTPGTGGIEVFSSKGSFLKRIDIGADSMTTNLCFGGPNMTDLFVTAAKWGKLLRLKVHVPGLKLYSGQEQTA